MGKYKLQGDGTKSEARSYEDFVYVKIQTDRISVKFQGTYFLLGFRKSCFEAELREKIGKLKDCLNCDYNVSQVDIAFDFIGARIEDLVHFSFHDGVYFQFISRAKLPPLYRYLPARSGKDGECKELHIVTSNYEIYFYRKDATINNGTEKKIGDGEKVAAYEELYGVSDFKKTPVARFETRLKYNYAAVFEIMFKNEESLSFEEIAKLALSEFYKNRNVRLRGKSTDKEKYRWKLCEKFRILTFQDLGASFNHFSPSISKHELIRGNKTSLPLRAANNFIQSSLEENLDAEKMLNLLFDLMIIQKDITLNGTTRQDLRQLTRKVLNSKPSSDALKEFRDAIKERAD